MFRYFIAFYLAVFSAAGPWLCCCATKAQAVEVAQAASEAPSCCQAHHHQSRNRSGSDQAGDETPSPDDGHCPCSHGATPAVLTAGSEKADVATTWAVTPAGATLEPVFAPVVDARRSPQKWREPCSLSGRALLASYCILRC